MINLQSYNIYIVYVCMYLCTAIHFHALAPHNCSDHTRHIFKLMWHLYDKVVHGNQSANHCYGSDTHHLYTTIRASLANTQLPSLLENTHAHILSLSLCCVCFSSVLNKQKIADKWCLTDCWSLKKKVVYMLILTSKKCWKLLVNAKPCSLNCTCNTVHFLLYWFCNFKTPTEPMQGSYQLFPADFQDHVFPNLNSNLTDYSPMDL